jgi:hypothetical protein
MGEYRLLGIFRRTNEKRKDETNIFKNRLNGHRCEFGPHTSFRRTSGRRNGNPAQAMIINTATGKIEKEIPIPTPVTGTHGQFRHIRMTKAGTLEDQER